MIVLKIIGIIFAVLILIVALILALRISICFEYALASEPRLYVRVLGIRFEKKNTKKSKSDEEAKEKKPSKAAEWIKKRLGIDIFTSGEALKQNVDEKGVSGTAESVAAVVSLVLGQIVWLAKRFRLDRLKIYAICADADAADAAMEYGLVCAAVYPFVGYLTSSINMKKNADDVRIFCDFEGKPYFETEIFVSVRTIHLVRAVLRNANAAAEAAVSEEEKV